MRDFMVDYDRTTTCNLYHNKLSFHTYRQPSCKAPLSCDSSPLVPWTFKCFPSHFSPHRELRLRDSPKGWWPTFSRKWICCTFLLVKSVYYNQGTWSPHFYCSGVETHCSRKNYKLHWLIRIWNFLPRR